MTFKLMAKHQRTPYCTRLLDSQSGGKVYSSVAVLCNSLCGVIAMSSCQQHLPTTTNPIVLSVIYLAISHVTRRA